MEEVKMTDERQNKEEVLSPDELMAMWESALKEAQSSQEASSVGSVPEVNIYTEKTESKEETQAVHLQELTPSKEASPYPELDFILDIPLEISVEIGRTKMLIRDLLKLNQGAIIELEKFAGEPVEVFVNGKLMAKGEVVVVNDRFGVRITEIISTQDRIKRLGS